VSGVLNCVEAIPVFQGVPVKEHQVNESRELTKLKVMRVVFTVFAAISFLCAFGFMCSPFLLFAWPSTGLAFFSIFSTPMIVFIGAGFSISAMGFAEGADAIGADLITRRKKMPLPKFVNEYGWKGVFRFCPMDNSRFQAKFREYAQTLTFAEICKLHSDASKGLKKSSVDAQKSYKIPALSEWKSLFEEETKDLGCLAICDHYPIDDLVMNGVITEDQKTCLDHAAAEREKILEAVDSGKVLEDGKRYESMISNLEVLYRKAQR